MPRAVAAAAPAARPTPCVETVAVLRNVLVVGVQRPMRSGVREEEEERVRGSRLAVLSDEAHRVVRDGIGVVPALGERLLLDVLLAAHQRSRLVEAARAFERSEEVIETPTGRPRVVGRVHVDGQVPLAAEAGRVAGRLEDLRHGRALLPEVAGIAVGRVVEVEDADADLVRMQTRHERCAGRAATGRVVELRHPNPALREAVQSWCRRFTAVAGDVREAHVVGQDEHDVGSGISFRLIQRSSEGSRDGRPLQPHDTLADENSYTTSVDSTNETQ